MRSSAETANEIAATLMVFLEDDLLAVEAVGLEAFPDIVDHGFESADVDLHVGAGGQRFLEVLLHVERHRACPRRRGE